MNEAPVRDVFAREVFLDVQEKMLKVFDAKQADYGGSFKEAWEEFGAISLSIRLKDKYSRFKELTKPGNIQMVSDESVEDTLMDMANYAILGIIELRRERESRSKLASDY